MASDFTQKGKQEIANQALNVVTETGYRIALPITGYVHDKNVDFVDAGSGTDLQSNELNVTNYTPGFGSASRKTPASRTLTRDDANARIELSHASATWTALGTGASAIIGVVHMISKTADTDSWIVAFDDTNDVTPNGGDVTYTPNAEGVLQF